MGHDEKDCRFDAQVPRNKGNQLPQKKEEASARPIKVADYDGSQPLVECFLDGNLLIGVVDTQSNVTLVREEVAARLQLTINTTDILNIRGYGSVDSGHTLGSVEVKLMLTEVELQMKIHIVANHLQPEDILIGKDVTENPGINWYYKTRKMVVLYAY